MNKNFKMQVAFLVLIVLTLSDGYEVYFDDVNTDSALQSENVSMAQDSTQDFLPYQRPVDCTEVLENGFKKSGVYEIYPKNRELGCSSFKVYCDMETSGGGWTVIQRRGDFQKPIDYFNKNWNQYKNGFGSLTRDFWLGNDYIYTLTNQKKYVVRFDLGTDKDTAYAVYDDFWIENEDYKYKLHITDYSGTAGDAMSYHNDMRFSTRDQKNNPSSSDCGKLRKAGWWFGDCARANLNGLFMKNHIIQDDGNATVWVNWKGNRVSLSTVEIKIRPLDF